MVFEGTVDFSGKFVFGKIVVPESNQLCQSRLL
jgi:hypothetical protein